MEDLPMAQRQYKIHKGMQEPMVYAASVNPDIMYLHEVMKVPDHDQFKKAMDKELKDHIAHEHWEVVPRSEVPKGTRVLDMVWAMWRKRHIDMREVYKWKAQLNVHGGQQQHGINYWEMYAPVVTWQTIHFFFILAIIRDWRIHQIDFVLVYTQAPAEVPLYMKFPHGYDSKYLPERVTKGSHILKLLCNIYGNKAAGRVWNKYLDKGLREAGFEVSKVDPCLYYKGGVILLVYIDDCILIGIMDAIIDEAVHALRSSKQNFTIEDEGVVGDFLGVRINRNDDGTIMLTQPQLIDSIIEDLNMQDNTKPQSIPACSTKLLHKDTDGESTEANFHYRSVIGKLNFREVDPSRYISEHPPICSIPRQPEEVTYPSCESHRALLDWHERQGHSDEAGPHQKLRVLGRCQLPRQLVRARSHEGSHDHKDTVRVGNHIHQMPYHLVIQTPDPHGTLNYRSRVCRTVIGIVRSNTDHATAEGGHRPRDR